MVLPVTLLGQWDVSSESGLKPYGSYHGSDIDTVSLSSGALSLHIPIVEFPQKGNLRLSFTLISNSKDWYVLSQGTGPSESWQYEGAGVTPVSNNDFVFANGVLNPPDGGTYSADSLADPTGAQHQFIFVQEGNGIGEVATDGSGFRVNGNLIVDRKGTTYASAPYTFSGAGTGGYVGTVIRDVFGNQISHSLTVRQPGQYDDAGWTDSIGRKIPGGPIKTIAPATNPGTAEGGPIPIIPWWSWTPGVPGSGLCPSGTAVENHWLLPAFAGGGDLQPNTTATYAYCYSNVALSTHFNLIYYFNPNTCGECRYSDPQQVVEGTGTALLLTTFILPNGQLWNFSYDSYGNVQRIGLPNGGSISYTYDNITTGEDFQVIPVSRAVTSRTEDAEDGTGPHTTYYSYGGTRTNSGAILYNYETIVTDPLGNDSVYEFYTGSDGGPLESNHRMYEGSYSSGVKLKTIDTTYYGSLPTKVATTTATAGGTLVQQKTMSYDPGAMSSQQVVERNGNLTLYEPESGFVYGSVVNSAEYDFGASLPTRQTATTFLWQTSSSYLSANLLDVPASSTLEDASGNPVLATIYGVDENNGSPQGVFGNITSVTRSGNAMPAVQTSTVYNSDGTQFKKIDARQSVTQFTYQCSGGAIQSVTAGYGLPLAEMTKYGVDCNTGIFSSHQDPNDLAAGRLGTTYVADNVGNLISVNYSDGGGLNIDHHGYANPLTITTTKTANPSPSVVSTFVYDGLGRAALSRVDSDPQGQILSAITYDANNRVQTTTNPYRPSESESPLLTTHYYDGLGRSVADLLPDGSVRTTCYNGLSSTSHSASCNPSNSVPNTTWIDLADEAGNVWHQSSDSFDNLLEVIEPAPSSALSPIKTDYAYDLLGNLRSVLQHGQANETARQRFFTYDALSRLTMSHNPETGTICYGRTTDSTPPPPQMAQTAL